MPLSGGASPPRAAIIKEGLNARAEENGLIICQNPFHRVLRCIAALIVLMLSSQTSVSYRRPSCPQAHNSAARNFNGDLRMADAQSRHIFVLQAQLCDAGIIRITAERVLLLLLPPFLFPPLQNSRRGYLP